MDNNILVYTPTDFNQTTYIEIIPQGSNLILIVIHTRPASELHDNFGCCMLVKFDKKIFWTYFLLMKFDYPKIFIQ